MGGPGKIEWLKIPNCATFCFSGLLGQKRTGNTGRLWYPVGIEGGDAVAAVIYGDVLFGLNFAVDGLLLVLSLRCVGRKIAWGRVLLAAALGGILGVWMVLPGGSFLNGGVAKLLTSLLLMGVAGGVRPAGRFVRAWLWFWLFSIALGGGMLCMSFLTGENYFAGAIDIPGWSLPAAGLALVLMVVLTIGRTRRMLLQEKSLGTVWIRMGDREVKLPVLVDSGCDVSEPLTGRPVLIAEAAAVEGILPGGFREKLRDFTGDTQKTAEALAAEGLSCRFRLIPYQSIGNRSGLLPGILPDGVKVNLGGNLWDIPGCVVALTDLTLSGDGAYRALVPYYAVEMKKKGAKHEKTGAVDPTTFIS